MTGFDQPSARDDNIFEQMSERLTGSFDPDTLKRTQELALSLEGLCAVIKEKLPELESIHDTLEELFVEDFEISF